jgi:ribosomal protein RSM22 (predicted rRNA methylase)
VQHAAYLGARLPATYAAVSATLAMVPDEVRAGVGTVLDLGAGPGTATWAAHARCPALRAARLVDRSEALLAIAGRLALRAGIAEDLALETHVADAARRTAWPGADLVIAAYALAELVPPARVALIESAWAAASSLLVLVEPGTPAGFAHLHAAREQVLRRGAHVVAPCPHDRACPLRPDGGRDWCHFAVRVPRTRLHRQLKGGTLGYEDEKFACLVVARQELSHLAAARVLRHPQVEKGRVGLTLCTPDGVSRVTVGRREPAYRDARKVSWGEAWAPSATEPDEHP